MKKQTGQIIIPSGVNVWAHELKTAQALADAGFTVEFIRKSEGDRERSADAYISQVKWEFKAPNGSKLSLVEKNLRRGLKQCDKIIFDSRRVKRIPDDAIERELVKWSMEIKGLGKLKFINRHRKIIDIK
ncbi:MAG: hypothetical protein FWC99_06905 [Coriobacteriia bacterium]|nr:hypothetical protein [Coriobacteriia bacterium]